MVYTALPLPPCHEFPQQAGARVIPAPIPQKKLRPPKGEVSPGENLAEPALELRFSGSPTSCLSRAVEKNSGAGDRRGGADFQGLGPPGRHPGRSEVCVWVGRKGEVI